ncbi:MAG: hypothetical protein LZF61_00205 [Nitrosomonas sp.]|nr:MAG: hypothetical protein LZF61_00205 [Nitrosomonas sp.]
MTNRCLSLTIRYVEEMLISWLHERIAPLRGIRFLTYLVNRLRSLCSVHLAFHCVRRIYPRFPSFLNNLLLCMVVTTASIPVWAQQSGYDVVHRSIPWRILAGEDLTETARLIYPRDSSAREHLIRAIIRINPDQFPYGVIQSLEPGTVIQFPDLRTIGVQAKRRASGQSRIKAAATSSDRRNTGAPEAGASLHSDPGLLQLIARLEKIADDEMHALAALTNHIAALESLFGKMQALASLEIPVSASEAAERLPLAAPDENFMTPSHPGNPTDNTASVTIGSGSAPAAEQQAAHNAQSMLQDAIPESSVDFFSSTDQLFLLAILLALLMVLVFIRYRSPIKKFFVSSRNAAVDASRHEQQYESLLLRRNATDTRQFQPLSASVDQAIAEVNQLIEQNNNEAAIALLQKQLAAQHHDIQSWLRLFELLYKTGNRRDFKKNARRFKRMNLFPDIWQQIQALGSRLEPNESLYFNEQKRKEKFFPEPMDSTQ